MQKKIIEKTNGFIDASNMEGHHDLLLPVLSESVFIVLPLLIFIIVLVYQQKANSIFYAPEWSMISTIIYGQLTTKVVKYSAYNTPIPDRINFFSLLIIVVGLIPSLVILAISLIDQGHTLWVYIVQMTIFVISLAAYILFGLILNHPLNG
jgi:hypothetical protein